MLLPVDEFGDLENRFKLTTAGEIVRYCKAMQNRGSKAFLSLFFSLPLPHETEFTADYVRAIETWQTISLPPPEKIAFQKSCQSVFMSEQQLLF